MITLLPGLKAQESSSRVSTELLQQLGSLQSQISSALIPKGILNVAVDENEYVVDAGDVFIIKIDVEGPAVNIFQTAVSPEGVLFLPSSASVNIQGKVLKDARSLVQKLLEKSHPRADIEVLLFNTHQIAFRVVGAVRNEGRYELSSSFRLNDAIQYAMREIPEAKIIEKAEPPEPPSLAERLRIFTEKEDSVVNPESRIGLRQVQIIRKNMVITCDLLRFTTMGDMKQNPYLMHDDVIRVPFKEENRHSIEVAGAVQNPRKFEFLPGDRVADAINFAGTFLPYADSSRIEIFRIHGKRDKIEQILVDFRESPDFALKPDDRIMVRENFNSIKKLSVEIIGEVKYPGKYPIQEGNTSLAEIIRTAGGFTTDASMSLSRVIRTRFHPPDREMERLMPVQPFMMTDIERSYILLRAREDIRVVYTDFEKLFVDSDSSFNVLLRDQDIIYVPRKLNSIFVSGSVYHPGNVGYREGWSIDDYVQAAGGYSSRARREHAKLIKNKTGHWIDRDDIYVIEDGDMIFIPAKSERTLWSFFKEGVSITTQIAAVVAVIVALYR